MKQRLILEGNEAYVIGEIWQKNFNIPIGFTERNKRDFAKIGQLCLDSGAVNGNQIINKKYLSQSFAPVNVPDKNGNPVNYYGYQWWMTSYKGMQVNMARGILGQYIMMIPEKKLVIVRLGSGRSDKYINEFPTDVFLYLDIALKMI